MSRYYNSSYSFSLSNSPYRYPYRRSYGLIVFALMILIMSWEAQKTDAAMTTGAIPEEAIRLRILAHSDRPADQLIKRVVRDEIVKAMNGWVDGPASIEEARAALNARMPEIERIVAETLASRGFDYAFTAELGPVQFPTKMYGSQVYPAGEYEALLITLGEGKGQNWWCVLFPPLCFVDAATGEASASTAAVQDTGAAKIDDEAKASGNEGLTGEGKGGAQLRTASAEAADTQAEAPKVKFFLWEMLEALIDWIKSLFGK
jgi:stage II sporulation protein R